LAAKAAAKSGHGAKPKAEPKLTLNEDTREARLSAEQLAKDQASLDVGDRVRSLIAHEEWNPPLYEGDEGSVLAIKVNKMVGKSADVQFEVDAPPIWTQALQYMKFRKETRGYLPLEHLMNDLENDDDPAHPEPSVTVNSLLSSWPTMTESQAAWLMGMLDTHTQGAQEKEAEKKAKEQVKHLAEENKEKLVELSGLILENSLRLTELENLNGGASETSLSLDKLIDLVTDLNVSVQKVRKEHDRLAVKVEDMMAAVPEGHRLELVEGAPVSAADTAASGRRAREWKKATPAAGKALPAPSNAAPAAAAPTASRRDFRAKASNS